MGFGFWILVALFFAGLWWFGRASEWKAQCQCVEVRQEPERSSMDSSRRYGNR